jgi:hypothetical protein
MSTTATESPSLARKEASKRPPGSRACATDTYVQHIVSNLAGLQRKILNAIGSDGVSHEQVLEVKGVDLQGSLA